MSENIAKILTLAAGILVIVAIWGLANFGAKMMASHTVIHPTSGVSCVVVSRMFNTSVDC